MSFFFSDVELFFFTFFVFPGVLELAVPVGVALSDPGVSPPVGLVFFLIFFLIFLVGLVGVDARLLVLLELVGLEEVAAGEGFARLRRLRRS